MTHVNRKSVPVFMEASLLGNKETKQIITKKIITATKENYCKI